MCARAALCICRVLGENGEAVGRGLSIKRTKTLLKILINGQGSLLARLVFNGRNNASGLVNKVDAGKALDGRQKLEITLERNSGLDHRHILLGSFGGCLAALVRCRHGMVAPCLLATAAIRRHENAGGKRQALA